VKEELFRNADDILNSIWEDEFVRVFGNWMSRLEQMIGMGGGPSKHDTSMPGLVSIVPLLDGDSKGL
jgi:hypothetical protein